MTAARALASLRRGCLAYIAQLKYIRVSNTDRARDAVFASFLGESGNGRMRGNWGGEDFTILEPSQVAVNLRLFSSATSWRSSLVRGMPDNAIDPDGQLRAAGPFLTALRAFANGTKTFAIQKRGLGAEVVITAVTIIAGRLQSIITDGPIVGLDARNLIQISGQANISNLTGLWRIRAALAGNQYLLFPKLRLNAGTLSLAAAGARAVTYTYPAINDYEIVGVTSRRTGRPLYLPRGRRSVQRN